MQGSIFNEFQNIYHSKLLNKIIIFLHSDSKLVHKYIKLLFSF